MKNALQSSECVENGNALACDPCNADGTNLFRGQGGYIIPDMSKIFSDGTPVGYMFDGKICNPWAPSSYWGVDAYSTACSAGGNIDACMNCKEYQWPRESAPADADYKYVSAENGAPKSFIDKYGTGDPWNSMVSGGISSCDDLNNIDGGGTRDTCYGYEVNGGDILADGTVVGKACVWTGEKCTTGPGNCANKI